MLKFFRRKKAKYVACSECFADEGIRINASRIGSTVAANCPKCGVRFGMKLTCQDIFLLADMFFSRGTIIRTEYGMAPQIYYNKNIETSVEFGNKVAADAVLFRELIGIGFGYYGPNLWMIGEIEPLKRLVNPELRISEIDRIFNVYPSRLLPPRQKLYRIRSNFSEYWDPIQYDSPPLGKGNGRFNAVNLGVWYGSQDLEICIQECRVNGADEVYVCVVESLHRLRLLDLTHIVDECSNEYESLDLAIQFLFLASEHSYDITRGIAERARDCGYHGIIYPSYFSSLRTGLPALEAPYGLSLRKMRISQEYEKTKIIPNIALFGKPISDGRLSVCSINRLLLERIKYDYFLGLVLPKNGDCEECTETQRPAEQGVDLER